MFPPAAPTAGAVSVVVTAPNVKLGADDAGGVPPPKVKPAVKLLADALVPPAELKLTAGVLLDVNKAAEVAGA